MRNIVRNKSPGQADKILFAAAQLFAKQRFHEARMEDIAALAEVGKGTLYRYFKDKEELYLALLQQAATGLQERLRQELELADSPRDQLVAVIRGLLGYFDEHPHLSDLIQHTEVMQRPGREFPWQKVRNQTLTLVKDILQAGASVGQFTVANPELAGLMLLGGLRSVFRFGPRPRPDHLAEDIADTLLGGHAACCGATSGPLLVEKEKRPAALTHAQ
jgi:AcrR family transcriptional regulator